MTAPPTAPTIAPITPAGFRLMRFFTVATLMAFAVVAAALFVLQRGEEAFFAEVQSEQRTSFAAAQAALAHEHDAAARRSLLAVHESSHVNLTRLFANMLWSSDLAPFLATAQRVPADACRATPANTPASRDCAASVGRSLTALPGFRALDAKVYAAMRSSTVFKVKVFDTRGLTVYSSEQVQVGEDAQGNMGWKTAMSGAPASELTHRDRFSAFESVVENRDLISTYVPVRATSGGPVVGVVELYSDVTPFLGQIRVASRQFAELSAANEARAALASRANQQRVEDSSDGFLAIVGGLLLLLYGVSLLVVRNGQRIIDAQRLAQEQAAQRERLWHREKMAALATMAANVSHEVGNPLAIVAGIAATLPESAAGEQSPGRQILAQTQRIAAMTRQISDFAGARSEGREWLDVSARVKAVCDFLRFDRRLGGTPIDFEPTPHLPACELVPDDFDELTMGLLQAVAHEAAAHAPGARLRVQTTRRSGRGDVVVSAALVTEVPGPWPPPGRLDALQRRAAEVGVTLLPEGQGAAIVLTGAAGTF